MGRARRLSSENHSAHASFGTSNRMFDSRSMSSARRESLKRNAQIERHNVKLGIPAGDRIQHRAFLSIPELDLFEPPIKLPEGTLSNQIFAPKVGGGLVDVPSCRTERVDDFQSSAMPPTQYTRIAAPAKVVLSIPDLNHTAQTCIRRTMPELDLFEPPTKLPRGTLSNQLFKPRVGDALADVPSFRTARTDDFASSAKPSTQYTRIAAPANILPSIPKLDYTAQTCLRRTMPELDELLGKPERQDPTSSSEQNRKRVAHSTRPTMNGSLPGGSGNVLTTKNWDRSQSSSPAINTPRPTKETLQNLLNNQQRKKIQIQRNLSHEQKPSSQGSDLSAPKKLSVLDEILSGMNALSPKPRSPPVSSMHSRRESPLAVPTMSGMPKYGPPPTRNENRDLVRSRAPLEAGERPPRELKRPRLSALPGDARAPNTLRNCR